MKKKHILFVSVLIVVLLVFSSCASRPKSSYGINRMRYDEPVIPYPDFEKYDVIGRVSGKGTVTNQKLSNGMFNGDTGKYGGLERVDSIYFNVSGAGIINFRTPYDVALANAIYQMIEQADDLKADAIVFVRSKTTSETNDKLQTISVSVTGTAIKLKASK